MKQLLFSLASGLAVLTSAAAAPAQAAPGQAYEAIVTPGSSTTNDNFFRIEVATGKTVSHCCGAGNGDLTPVAEAVPLPPGDYHLLSWSTNEGAGKLSYSFYRFDAKSGRAWSISGGGPTPFLWKELVAVH